MRRNSCSGLCSDRFFFSDKFFFVFSATSALRTTLNAVASASVTICFSIVTILAAMILVLPSSVAQTSDATPLAKQVANLEEKLSRDERTLQDWPNLARYREANGVVAAPAKDAVRVDLM